MWHSFHVFYSIAYDEIETMFISISTGIHSHTMWIVHPPKPNQIKIDESNWIQAIVNQIFFVNWNPLCWWSSLMKPFRFEVDTCTNDHHSFSQTHIHSRTIWYIRLFLFSFSFGSILNFFDFPFSYQTLQTAQELVMQRHVAQPTFTTIQVLCGSGSHQTNCNLWPTVKIPGKKAKIWTYSSF